MPHTQKLLKLFIRLMLPIVTIGGFGGVWGLVLAGQHSQNTVSAVWSEDGRYRARVVEAQASYGCGYSSATYVVVERAWFHIKTGQVTPLCVPGSTSQLRVGFSAPNELVIRCLGCGEEVDYQEQPWGDLRFVYQLDSSR